jgi:hypothetical protein
MSQRADIPTDEAIEERKASAAIPAAEALEPCGSAHTNEVWRLADPEEACDDGVH